MSASESSGAGLSGITAGSAAGQRPIPSCTSLFDRFWYCASPGSQFSYYYRNGDIEYCPTFLSDWGTCLKAQLVHDEARKREIMAGTSVMQPISKPNTVLVKKDPPSWT